MGQLWPYVLFCNLLTDRHTEYTIGDRWNYGMTEVFVMKLYRLTNRTTGNRWNYGMTENFVMKLYRLTIGHTGTSE